MSDARTGVLELTLGDSYIGSAYSPQVEVTDTDTGHEVAITYMSPSGLVTERFDVADGERGPQGPAGFSPTVTITDTPTGHTVTITDEDGPHSYDVPNYAQEEQERQDAWDALSGEVTDAISDAETATSAASTAAQSATSAATSATSAAQAATTAAASASTAASSANAAATAANSAATAAGTAADAATTAAQDATDAASAANTAAQAAQEAATEVAPEVKWLWGNQLTKQVEGELLTAADAYAAPPMALTVDGRSTQDGTPTPDAPVPIESVDELTLAFAGKNLLELTNPVSKTASTYTYENGILTVTATLANGWCYLRYRVSAVESMRGRSVTLSAIVSGERSPFFGIEFHRADDSRISYATGNQMTTRVVPDDTSYIDVVFYARGVMAGAVGDTATYSNIQLELGSTATAYQPYEGASVPLYDGTLRSLPDGTKDTLALTYLRPSTREGWAWYSRELVQAVGHVAINGTEYWRSSSYTTSNMLVAYLSGLYFDNVFVDRPAYYSPTYMAQKVMCDRFSPYIPVAGTMQTTQGIAAYVTEADFGQCFVSMSTATVSDVDAFKTWAAANPFVIDYPLATPVTHDLGEVELPVLPAPTCTVWADPTTGLQMEYVRDSNLVVQSLSAETAIAYASIATVDGPTATASHAVGTYLTMDGTLYKVTQAIAVGETIAAGTNVTATTVMAELIARTA